MSENLEVSVDIAASPEQVWAVVSDLRRMPEFSPQCRKMFVLGSLRVGARTININRNGRIFYLTASKIIRVEPNTAIAWQADKAVWSYVLEPTVGGTRLIERRDLAKPVTGISKAGLPLVFGSAVDRDAVLTDGMRTTLGRIKAAVEGA
ncbi:SRPBCC family protein [Antrihabitans sp. YC2-6]|uniref:SRPBCC family protein n=1 Tax=Antrihabitans sp. YC2-6 TaxID=2799498 RepID=UPI0018F328A5|nr:SRPBCC family protein [Antrihabitans sp. YC2-6]MBJ8345730.1 SRPBCC family protein [Antrihabitans sp. YC2-6]